MTLRTKLYLQNKKIGKLLVRRCEQLLADGNTKQAKRIERAMGIYQDVYSTSKRTIRAFEQHKRNVGNYGNMSTTA